MDTGSLVPNQKKYEHPHPELFVPRTVRVDEMSICHYVMYNDQMMFIEGITHNKDNDTISSVTLELCYWDMDAEPGPVKKRLKTTLTADTELQYSVVGWAIP